MHEFDLSRIRNETFVQQIDFHPQIPSTNTCALQWAEQGALATPLLVLTQQQTQGRGRGQNRWWSAPGSLTFSLLIDLLDLPTERVTQLSLTAGLAICRTVERYAPTSDVAIKWPNDVYLEGRKLAGVLIELPARRPLRAVIGVGINANNSLAEAPAELMDRCITLRDHLAFVIDSTQLLVDFLGQFAAQLKQLRLDPRVVVGDWDRYDLLRGREVDLDTYDGLIKGTAMGIDDQGALVIQSERGLQRCLGGVVRRFSAADHRGPF
jgi:BirA family biotin operon repressor/biotin-[acetyl-CoA-carboxylase] ligase